MVEESKADGVEEEEGVRRSWTVASRVAIRAYILAFESDLWDKANVDLLYSMKEALLGIHGDLDMVGIDSPQLLVDSLEGQDIRART